MSSVSLHQIDVDAYAHEVLPQTAALWSAGRDFRTYVSHNLEIANGRYGRRHFRTFGLFDAKRMVSSFKHYDRAMHLGTQRLRAFGIGAVFTPPEYRGRGYAGVMLATALDRARAAGYDIAFLFSDIRPQFYSLLGFTELPSHEIVLRADTLPSVRLAPEWLSERDWRGVQRCYELGERSRAAGFLRTPLVWEYVRVRLRQDGEGGDGTQTHLVVRHGRGVGAYVLGARIPQRDAYVVHEFGFAGASSAQAIPALLRAAAGDLRRIVGWLPPEGAREALPKGSLRRRKHAIFMAAPLSLRGKRLVRVLAGATADGCWHADHV
ncbi:MAG: GNAT family N-acetyltransferase [Candidatus Eremiobacteraeota bacterium]|nr:GNAT family N-acetyltransferase [Candidatus Eremiobacteraeota bacterium]MBV8373478.1 GNAT family N-acetyltransferase [Candidatus Eremiobacteraeota bacterium]